MKKYMLVFSSLISTILISCQDETESFTNQEQQKFVESKLQKRYGLQHSESDFPVDLSGFDTEATIPLKGRGLYVTLNDPSMRIYAIRDVEEQNRYYVYKVVQEGLQKEFLSFEGSIEIQVNATGTGYVSLCKEGETMMVYFKEKRFDKTKTMAYMNASKVMFAGLCQRKRGENFKKCFTRESDEFCTDFVSTVAYYTNPSIPVLIAALCSC